MGDGRVMGGKAGEGIGSWQLLWTVEKKNSGTWSISVLGLL